MRIQDQRRWLLRLVLAFLCLALTLLLAILWSRTRYGSLGTTDFIQYWSAGQLLLQGHNPYDLERLLVVEETVGWPHEIPLVMWNPPWLLIWFLPLLLLDFQSAALVWLGVNFAIILLSATWIWRSMVPSKSAGPVIPAWLGGCFFAPALTTLGLGQVSGLNLLGVVLFAACVGKEQYFRAGLFIALTTVKIHVVYLVWPFILWWVFRKRQWRVLAGLGTVLAASAAVLTTLRPGWVFDYAAAMRSPPLYWATPTLGGILREFLGVSWPQVQYLPPLMMLSGALIFLAARRSETDWSRDLAPLLLISVITSAFAWSYDQIVLMVPFLGILACVLQKDRFSRVNRGTMFAGLVIYSGALFAMNLLGMDELDKFWLSWLLGLLYLFSRRLAGRESCGSLG